MASEPNGRCRARPRSGGDGPVAVLIGAKPRDGWQALNRLNITFMLLTDEADGEDGRATGAVSVHPVPFKADPLSVLRVPVPASVRAVFSFTELGLLPAALLSEALGLPTVPVASVLRTRDKLMMRRALRGSVGQPAFGPVGVYEPADRDFPVVVKPVDGSGSRGLEFIAGPDEYARRSAALRGNMWERYIEGPEYSVEAITADGTHHVLGITEKTTTGPPNFVETGHIVPAPLPAAVAEEISRCARICLGVLGVTAGASHTEVKVHDGSVALIETHTRAGGDRIPVLIELVTGYDQYAMAIQSVLDPGTHWTARRDRYAAAGVRYFPWQGVTLRAVTGLGACARSEGVVEVELHANTGHRIPPWRYSHERPGYVLARAGSRAELIRRLDAAERLVVADLAEDQPQHVSTSLFAGERHE